MTKVLLAVTLIGMSAVPGAVAAQPVFGLTAAHHADYDFGFVGFVSMPANQIDEALSLRMSVGYFLPFATVSGSGTTTNVTYYAFNGDLTYDFFTDRNIQLFALAGLRLTEFTAVGTREASTVPIGCCAVQQEHRTQFGLNLGGGITLSGGSVIPVVGAK